MFFIVKDEKYMILEFWDVRNINKVIRQLGNQFKKVPRKVPPYEAFKRIVDNFKAR